MGLELSPDDVKRLERESWDEATFTSKTIEQTQGRGFKTAHFRPAETARGWRTAVQGDGAGFSDLVGINKQQGRGLAWELKVKKKTATKEQLDWLAHFAAMGFDARVCYPSDWDSMMRYLEVGK